MTRLIGLLIRITILTAPLAMLGGCNTIEGAGKDIAALGKGTAAAAHDINPYNK